MTTLENYIALKWSERISQVNIKTRVKYNLKEEPMTNCKLSMSLVTDSLKKGPLSDYYYPKSSKKYLYIELDIFISYEDFDVSKIWQHCNTKFENTFERKTLVTKMST